MRMSEVQAQALAAFVSRIRPEWNVKGIVAALEKAAPTGDVHDVACALIRLAADPTVKTPGMLPQPGAHWLKPDGTKPVRRGDHTMTCPDPDHGGERMPCGQCASNTGAPPAEVLAEIAAAIEHGKTTQQQRDAEKAAREEKKRCAT